MREKYNCLSFAVHKMDWSTKEIENCCIDEYFASGHIEFSLEMFLIRFARLIGQTLTPTAELGQEANLITFQDSEGIFHVSTIHPQNPLKMIHRSGFGFRSAEMWIHNYQPGFDIKDFSIIYWKVPETKHMHGWVDR